MKPPKNNSRTAIVIGATSGIGRAVALSLASEGYRVGITGRRTALLGELAAADPDAFVARNFDISDPAATAAALDALAVELGGIGLVFISSGTGDINASLDPAVEQNTIDTNVTGFTAAACWAFSRFERQGYGHLAAVTSVAALRGDRHAPAYSATKAFQSNYLEGLRGRARHSGLPVHVTDIRPGFVDTAMAKGDGLFWVAPVDKAVRQIMRAIRRRRSAVYITRRWRMVAWLLKALPRGLYDKI